LWLLAPSAQNLDMPLLAAARIQAKISRLSDLQWSQLSSICSSDLDCSVTQLLVARSARAAYGSQCHVVTMRLSQDRPLHNRNLAVTWFVGCRSPVLHATVHRRTGPLRHSQAGWLNDLPTAGHTITFLWVMTPCSLLASYRRVGAVAYPGILFGGVQKIQLRTEDGENGDLGAVAPPVRGSGGSCNLVQEISFHIVKFS